MTHRLETDALKAIQKQRANIDRAEKAYRDSGLTSWPWTEDRRKAALERGEMIPLQPGEQVVGSPLPEVRALDLSFPPPAEFPAMRMQLDQQETRVRAALYRSPEVRGRTDELLREAMPHVEALLPIAAELTELADLAYRSRLAAGQVAGLEPRGEVDAVDVVEVVLNPGMDLLEPVKVAAPRGAHFTFDMGTSDPAEPRVTSSQVRQEADARRMQRLRIRKARFVPGIRVQTPTPAEPEATDEPAAS